jgi:hypothetical protein
MHQSGAYDQIFISLRPLQVFFYVGRSLWRENGSAVYNCCWSSPVQSLSGPSPGELVTISYCLRFETPQPGGLGPSIYIPQEQGGTVIPQALGSLFVPSYVSEGCGGGILTNLMNKFKLTLRLTVSQSVSLAIEPYVGLMTRYLLLSDSYGLVFVGRPLWREDGSVICIWISFCLHCNLYSLAATWKMFVACCNRLKTLLNCCWNGNAFSKNPPPLLHGKVC